ncbi:MAG: asparagine synthase B, partial [Lysobacterales bacterium]
MCGIAGIYGFEGDEGALRRRLEVMGATMVHRGPDGHGVHVDSNPRAGLVVRRLAIVDPEHGEQPMYSEDGTVAVVCNGEIYNHLALRQELEGKGYRLRSRSDCEVLAQL